MALRESNPSVPAVGFSVGRDGDRDDYALYGELDWNHFRVRCWSVWIHGYRALYGTPVGEFDCILVENGCQCLLWPGRDLRRSSSSGLEKRVLVLEWGENHRLVTLANTSVIGVNPCGGMVSAECGETYRYLHAGTLGCM